MFCANERLEREREWVTIVCDSKVVDSRAMIKKKKQKLKIAFLPTKHLRVYMNSFKRVRAFQIELEFGSVGFWGEGKTGVPGEKPLGAMERTNNKLNPHMASTPGFETGRGERSHHCATLAPLKLWEKNLPGQWVSKIHQQTNSHTEGEKGGDNFFCFQFPLEKPGKKRVRNARKLLKIDKLRSPRTSNRRCQENKLIRISSAAKFRAVIPMSSWCYNNDPSLNVIR